MFRRCLVSLAPLKVGDSLPAAKFFVGIAQAKTTEELFANKRVLVLAVPGAFTPTCSKQLPDYVKDAPKLKAKFNVTDIYCLTRNDSFVNDAWEKASNATGVVTLVSDPFGDFLAKSELKVSIPIFGEDRYARFAAVVDNQKVENLWVEPDGKGASCSLSDSLLK